MASVVTTLQEAFAEFTQMLVHVWHVVATNKIKVWARIGLTALR